jgi:polysaccharide pyruvyl transferase WcaK-like protein
VRDPASSRLLDRLGIEHALVPDAVHALGVLWPAERDPAADVAIVQISSAILRQLGHAEVGARIAASRELRGRPVRLLLAGTATGHDSVADYEALMSHARGVDLAILDGRRPLDIVDHIRRARVVVGTSLHVRIIAAAYGVPRITLSRWKPTQYARAWDAEMPFDVALDDLDAAIAAAVAAGRRPEVAERSASLAWRAHEHLGALSHRVLALAASESAADRAARAEMRRMHASATRRRTATAH